MINHQRLIAQADISISQLQREMRIIFLSRNPGLFFANLSGIKFGFYFDV